MKNFDCASCIEHITGVCKSGEGEGANSGWNYSSIITLLWKQAIEVKEETFWRGLEEAWLNFKKLQEFKHAGNVDYGALYFNLS